MKPEKLKVKITRLMCDHSRDNTPEQKPKSDFKNAFYVSLTIFSVMGAIACVLITQAVRF